MAEKEKWPGLGNRPRSMSPTCERRIVKEFRKGVPAAEIARREKLARHVVYTVLNREKIRPELNQSRTKPGKPPEVQAAIVEFYNKPESIMATANHFGIPYGTARKILNKHKVLRPDGLKKFRSEKMIDEMVSLSKQGLSQTKIGKRFNVNQTVVSRLLRKRGLSPKRFHCVGENHGSWKGGTWKDSNGYVWVRIAPDDPLREMANSTMYLAEHRLVMARHLGRPLTKKETVHHINGKRDDNRIENLQLRKGRHGTGVVMCCADCGSRNIVEAPISD